jgi:hypothetical protein
MLPTVPPRTFPDPDPFLQLIDHEEPPQRFWSIPKQDQSRRLRLFLIARNALGPRHPMLLWTLAMGASDREAIEIVDRHTDEAITQDINEAMAYWIGFYASGVESEGA